MRVHIDAASKVPLFEQVRVGILDQVRSGELIVETKIPTVRGLAAELGIAPHTVAKAYKELETQGVIEARGRLGTFIASGGDPTEDNAARAAMAYVAELRALGLTDDKARALLETALRS
ncbi:MAG: GntR family transcriptional regulator [Rhodococcus sp. (in: high G+C Gram-positive bacteria)]|jgi:DNA-binding transcriptional regulator YhcF (GntR family)|uniref:GntR family transcriptional regulator n=1 Tax=Rhodococcus sp. EPR-157 TaxID=1813677 RepID=UPI0007BAFCC6|nr:GntR family transcriptional regulator [Rhodococcus sp. EPR-157]KZF03022.1 GntR family transcriptional regulator [Rhodococcus sp. EPR-157]